MLLILWASLSTFQIIYSAAGPQGGNDLYTYWYAGLHIRQGTDPYRAFLSGTNPRMPISFLDGVATQSNQVVRSDLQPAPGLTFPLIYLLTPFAWFTFNTARVLWFILLLVLNIVIPSLLIRAMLPGKTAPEFSYLILVCIFMGLSSTRYATISGQPSILVIALMMTTWMQAKRRPILAGLLLGVALSKYSLALGFWVYFTLVEIRPKLSLSALGVQLLGLIGLAWLGESSLFQAMDGYIQLFLHHAPMEGIQLTSLFPGLDAFSPPLALGLTLSVGLSFGWVLKQMGVDRNQIDSSLLRRAIFLTSLTFWSLLVAYHRAYDLQVFLILVGCALVLLNMPLEMKLNAKWVNLTQIYAIVAVILLSLPAGSFLRQILPGELGSIWVRLVLRASTWMIVIGLGITLALLFQDTRREKVSLKT